jgi:hypothetical protein
MLCCAVLLPVPQLYQQVEDLRAQLGERDTLIRRLRKLCRSLKVKADRAQGQQQQQQQQQAPEGWSLAGGSTAHNN